MRPVYLLFLLSGAAGLLYQVIWSRLLHEFFGVTAYAITTVLATFLGGLALARTGGDPRRTQQVGDRLALYRQGIPLHQVMARSTSAR